MKPSPLLTLALVLSLLIVLAQASHAADESGIRVVVQGLRNNHGRVGCSLFSGPDGFPRNQAKEFRGLWAKKHHHVAVCDFTNVPPGIYAVTVLDDSNMNGKMDFNLVGLPTKGYGFSKDAKATLSPPSFGAASFRYEGEGSLSVPINIVYRTR